ncbi:hypothetical protein EMPS_11236 [Entomortierella parvispora]|uniref:Pentatricopeptide repeat-containing protein-mitochondrial domain-containing protein n=1 Tax=Entomortierella parvispora TaxID=205924 RepID=A0A9P3M249_9FUNG|nr:hypothetical protein EMPS_11236 [Entomortierella parvispora]
MLPRSIQLQAAQRCIHSHTTTTVVAATNNVAQPALLRRNVSSLTSYQARLHFPRPHYPPHCQQQSQFVNGPMHAGCSTGSTRTIITGTYPSSRLDLFNKKLRKIAKDPRTCLVLFEKFRELKDSKLKPDLTTYTILLEGHERNNDFSGLMRTLEEMTLAGVLPDISAYNIGLRAAAVVGDTIMLEQIKDMIRESGLQLNLNSYEFIIQGLCHNHELEHALDLLGDMTVSVNEEGLPDENGRPTIDIRPSLQCFIPVIQLAQSLHESETAYLVLKMAEVQSGLSQISPVIYLDLLAKAAEDYALPAVEYCWRKAVKEMKAQPDEGTCMLILNCAGQGVAPKLSAEVIQYMGESGMTFQEYHFAPLLQAFSLGKKFKSAFNVLSIMRKSGMQPSILTATSLLKVLDDPANIEEAFACMKSMHQEGKVIDVVAFNVLLEACGRNRNLIRAMAIFESSSSLGVTPDTDTYNALLSGCIMDKNMLEGRNVIAMMQRAGVDPNVDTYQSLITLCLTQINYEDAFMYLEEMKSHNVIPSEPIYTSLVRKLARENDPRIKFAVEEMESFGYVVGPNLRQYIETGGLSNLEESERRRQIRIAQRRRSAAFQRVRVR